MWDWGSSTKFEGSFVGHTFVARLASDPSVVIDKFTMEPTRIIDCPSTKKQQMIRTLSKNEEEAESVEEADGSAIDRVSHDMFCAEDNLIANGSGSMSRAAAGLSGTSG